MIEYIFLAILMVSLTGITVILYRKIPVLVKLPQSSKSFRGPIILKMKNGVKKLPGAEKFNCELYLQRILSRVRILTLKTENKTGGWLERLRQRANQKNNHQNDNYWEELKKAKDGK